MSAAKHQIIFFSFCVISANNRHVTFVHSDYLRNRKMVFLISRVKPPRGIQPNFINYRLPALMTLQFPAVGVHL